MDDELAFFRWNVAGVLYVPSAFIGMNRKMNANCSELVINKFLHYLSRSEAPYYYAVTPSRFSPAHALFLLHLFSPRFSRYDSSRADSSIPDLHALQCRLQALQAVVPGLVADSAAVVRERQVGCVWDVWTEYLSRVQRSTGRPVAKITIE